MTVTNSKAYTPNANMADHSVGTRDELHESEASEASVPLVLSNEKVLLRGRLSLFDFAVPTSFCVLECHQKG